MVCGGLGWFAVVCGGLRYFDGAKEVDCNTVICVVQCPLYLNIDAIDPNSIRLKNLLKSHSKRPRIMHLSRKRWGN